MKNTEIPLDIHETAVRVGFDIKSAFEKDIDNGFSVQSAKHRIPSHATVLVGAALYAERLRNEAVAEEVATAISKDLPGDCTVNGRTATFHGVFQARSGPVAVVKWCDNKNFEEVPVHLVRET